MRTYLRNANCGAEWSGIARPGEKRIGFFLCSSRRGLGELVFRRVLPALEHQLFLLESLDRVLSYGGCSARGHLFSGELALRLVAGAATSLTVDERLSILVELKLGDHNLGGIDADVNSGSVNLLAGDALDMDDPFLPVNLDDLALPALEGAAHYLHLIVLPDWHRPHTVLPAELRRERRAHELSSHAGRRREVSLAALAPGARNPRVDFHCVGGSGGKKKP
ncbi:hypothetical protein IEQ34_006934 [Dendrobium chrysotoxum]|uniref:Uncharacterized protein n=1 Tax=Dendrobium chrysotoxum TaxID=161865 RepID=A0AAV7H9J6_DENCH|nr:hypothetical protein IEQ34_006934 [Dendrobium chrysotoxum]